MKLYMAPLEGITGYVYRNALNDIFGGADKYYAPFITPPVKRELAPKEIRQLCRENNMGIKLVPQVLTASAEDFNLTKEVLRDMGYEEVNLNLGCPSKTVTAKGRGAAALQYPDKLDNFLYGIFEHGEEMVSIKTRIGVMEAEEFDRILEIYKKYPIMELTIHPRLMVQAYKGLPDKDLFFKAARNYEGALCYNGNIDSPEDFRELFVLGQRKLTDAVNNIPGSFYDIADEDYCFGAVMCGRGVLKNPSLFREIKGGEKATREELESFLSRLLEEYTASMSGETPVLYKMKEVWSYLGLSFDGQEKELKKLLKCKSISEYKIHAKAILRG